MGWSELDRRTPIALLFAVAACTDPTFRDEVEEAGAPALADGGAPAAAGGDAAQAAPNADARDAAGDVSAELDARPAEASDAASDAAEPKTDAGSASVGVPTWALLLLGRYLSLKIADGEVRSDREHVVHERRTVNASCVYATVDGCFLGNNTQCPGGFTDVLPLAADATCATVLAQSIPLPVPPSGDCREPTP